MKKLLQVYHINSKFILCPTCTSQYGFSKIIKPFSSVPDNCSYTQFGDMIAESINYCVIEKELPELNLFKELLKFSGARTQKNLLEHGQLVLLYIHDDLYEMKFQMSDNQNRSFVPRSPEKIIYLRKTDLSFEELAKIIYKEVFSQT